MYWYFEWGFLPRFSSGEWQLDRNPTDTRSWTFELHRNLWVHALSLNRCFCLPLVFIWVLISEFGGPRWWSGSWGSGSGFPGSRWVISFWSDKFSVISYLGDRLVLSLSLSRPVSLVLLAAYILGVRPIFALLISVQTLSDLWSAIWLFPPHLSCWCPWTSWSGRVNTYHLALLQVLHFWRDSLFFWHFRSLA